MEDHIPGVVYVKCSGKANHRDARLMVRGDLLELDGGRAALERS